MAYHSCFETMYDVVVVGSGFAGYAAALAAAAAGRRVLLIGPTGDVLWEAGRAFATRMGACDSPEWHRLISDVAARHGVAGEALDGATAEIVANRRLRDGVVDVLYYATPVAVERRGGGLTGLIVAGKDGPHRVSGRQWVDATEQGLVVRLAGGAVRCRAATAHAFTFFLQADHWPDLPDVIDGAVPVRVGRTAWASERSFTLEGSGGDAIGRAHLLEAVRRVTDAFPDLKRDAHMSHCAFVALPLYASGAGRAEPPSNVTVASPMLCDEPVTTPADRFALGERAARMLMSAPAAVVTEVELGLPIPPVEPRDRTVCEVAVAGLGTGGAPAAIAAARQLGGLPGGVVALDSFYFPGGIGTGGGINVYYHGVPGGLQQEIDGRVREVMDAFGSLFEGRGAEFHPVVKAVVLEAMLHEAGVTVRYGETVFGVRQSGGRVTSLLVAGPDGPREVTASCYVDATADGDVCAHAGAAFRFGRTGDGLPHAHSQSAGQLTRRENHAWRIRVVNFDAGWCDPASIEDLTRARLDGVNLYFLDAYTPENRVTYLAPALGLRQSRQFVTDVVMTLDDLIVARRFDDEVGFGDCHYDNHGVEYEFESDESLFWVWANRSWKEPVGAAISYRMLLPRGLDNVVIGSRCLGVSQDAHHSFRMQRDIQRVGEVAGIAAALARPEKGYLRAVPYARLRRELEKTGALRIPDETDAVIFGNRSAHPALQATPEADRIAVGLDALDRGVPGRALWFLYRAGPAARDEVRQRLARAEKKVSWLAACVCAMGGDGDAEARLLEAVRDGEYGFDPATTEEERQRRRKDRTSPEENPRLVPNWLVAVALLGRCGGERTFAVLDEFSRRADHTLRTRCTLALAVERLARRGVIPDDDRADAMLTRLAATVPADAVGLPQERVGWNAECALRGEPVTVNRHHPASGDGLWQLHAAVARARQALNRPMHAAARAYRDDDRALVRRVFERIQAGETHERQRSEVADERS